MMYVMLSVVRLMQKKTQTRNKQTNKQKKKGKDKRGETTVTLLRDFKLETFFLTCHACKHH